MAMATHDARSFNLDLIRIASPCTARWDDMAGDDRVRFCGACKLHVYDTSHMTAEEARALIVGRAGERTCLRLHRRADGTVITRDCPVGQSRRRARWLAGAAALLGFVAIGAPGAWMRRVVAGIANAGGADVPLQAQKVAPPPPPPAVPQAEATVEMGGAPCPKWDEEASEPPAPAAPRAK